MAAVPEPLLCESAPGGAPKAPPSLPPEVERAVWRADELGHRAADTCPTGWPQLDAELPGGGWPTQSVTEVLAAQQSVLEWRLLSSALARVVSSGGQVIVVGPPQHPHLPGLLQLGLSDRQLVWLRADSPAERLWTTEQLIKANAAGAIVAWLPQARPEHIRRLQVCAQACDGPVFLCRPDAARHEASAAPLRVRASVGIDWELQLEIVKRRGPALDQPLTLPSVPSALTAVLTPRLSRPSRLTRRPETPHVVGRPAVTPRPGQPAAA